MRNLIEKRLRGPLTLSKSEREETKRRRSSHVNDSQRMVVEKRRGTSR
jgi:hypothetical protein